MATTVLGGAGFRIFDESDTLWTDTRNEDIRAISAGLGSAISGTTDVLTLTGGSAPSEGDTYIQDAAGVNPKQIAMFYDGSFKYIQPWNGMTVRVEDKGKSYQYIESETEWREVVPSWQGIKVNKTTDQNGIGTTLTDVTWNNTLQEVGGNWYDNGTSTSLFTVPAGITKVRFALHILADTTNNDPRVQWVTGAGATFNGAAAARVASGSSNIVNFYAESGPVNVTPGDTFKVQARAQTGTFDIRQSADFCHCMIEAVDAPGLVLA